MRWIIALCYLLAACATSGRGKELSDVTIGYEIEVPVAYLPGNPSPCYPPGFEKVGGRVEARFFVDTLGRVEDSTVHIVLATNLAFVKPVLEVLPLYRFKPAWLQLSQRKARSLVNAPFDFLAEGSPADSVAASFPKGEPCKK